MMTGLASFCLCSLHRNHNNYLGSFSQCFRPHALILKSLTLWEGCTLSWFLRMRNFFYVFVFFYAKRMGWLTPVIRR